MNIDLDTIHKYVTLENQKDGSTIVRISGISAAKIAKHLESYYVWEIIPAFARLSYGATTYSDVPYCLAATETLENSVADVLLKLLDVGAMQTAVDIPEDTYAATVNEVAENAKDFEKHLLIEASTGVFDTAKKSKLLISGITLSEAQIEEIKTAITEDRLTALDKFHIYVDTVHKKYSFIDENTGLLLTSKVQVNEVVFTEEEIEEEQLVEEKITQTPFKEFKEKKKRIEEGLRLVSTHGNTSGKQAKVYKDSELGEHKVKFFVDGVHQKDADYHTDDKEDAKGTANTFVKEGRESEYSANLSLSGDSGADDKNKKIKIKSPTGKIVSAHATMTDAMKTFKIMPNNTGHKIVAESDGVEIDLMDLFESTQKDYEKAYSKWEADATAKHGSKGIKFKGRIEKGVHTTSAEIPGKDRSYGVFDHDTGTSHIFEEDENVVGELIVESVKEDTETPVVENKVVEKNKFKPKFSKEKPVKFSE